MNAQSTYKDYKGEQPPLILKRTQVLISDQNFLPLAQKVQAKPVGNQVKLQPIQKGVGGVLINGDVSQQDEHHKRAEERMFEQIESVEFFKKKVNDSLQKMRGQSPALPSSIHERNGGAITASEEQSSSFYGQGFPHRHRALTNAATNKRSKDTLLVATTSSDRYALSPGAQRLGRYAAPTAAGLGNPMLPPDVPMPRVAGERVSNASSGQSGGSPGQATGQIEPAPRHIHGDLEKGSGNIINAARGVIGTPERRNEYQGLMNSQKNQRDGMTAALSDAASFQTSAHDRHNNSKPNDLNRKSAQPMGGPKFQPVQKKKVGSLTSPKKQAETAAHSKQPSTSQQSQPSSQFINPARIIHSELKQKSLKQQHLEARDLRDFTVQESITAAAKSADKLGAQSPWSHNPQQQPKESAQVLSKQSSIKMVSTTTATASNPGSTSVGANTTVQLNRLANNQSRASMSNLKQKRNQRQLGKCQSKSQIQKQQISAQVAANKARAAMNLKRPSNGLFKAGQTPSSSMKETGQPQGTLLKKVAVACGASTTNFAAGEGSRMPLEARRQMQSTKGAPGSQYIHYSPQKILRKVAEAQPAEPKAPSSSTITALSYNAQKKEVSSALRSISQQTQERKMQRDGAVGGSKSGARNSSSIRKDVGSGGGARPQGDQSATSAAQAKTAFRVRGQSFGATALIQAANGAEKPSTLNESPACKMQDARSAEARAPQIGQDGTRDPANLNSSSASKSRAEQAGGKSPSVVLNSKFIPNHANQQQNQQLTQQPRNRAALSILNLMGIDEQRPKKEEPRPDPNLEKLLKFQERLREASKNEKAVEFQLICYEKLTQKQYSKFRNLFLQRLPSDNIQQQYNKKASDSLFDPKGKTWTAIKAQKDGFGNEQARDRKQQWPNSAQKIIEAAQQSQSSLEPQTDDKANEDNGASVESPRKSRLVSAQRDASGSGNATQTTSQTSPNRFLHEQSHQSTQGQQQQAQQAGAKDNKQKSGMQSNDLQQNSILQNQHATPENLRKYHALGSNSQKSQVLSRLTAECYKNPKMVNNLPAFYRSLINKITWSEKSTMPIFDYAELDQIVEATLSEQYPIISAKKWAISDKHKGVVLQGKNYEDQCEIASMTKLCTAYTVCRIMEEMGIYGIEQSKNIYMRVSRKAAFMPGTSAYVQTHSRLSLYDCMCALMIPSGNDAAITLATEFGRWLFLIGDKQRDSQLPIIHGKKGKINTLFSNCPKDVDYVINQSFRFPTKGHDDYLQAFMTEMNKQTQKLRLKNCKFSNPHGLQQKANHASASDMIGLMYYAMKYDLIAEASGKSRYSCEVYTWDLQVQQFTWENTNKLLGQHFVAAKTGITPSAGPCLVSHFKYGPYESQGVLIDSKTQDIRWKEMSTILLWQFDKFLKKHKLAAYNVRMVQEFRQMQQKRRQEKEAEELRRQQLAAEQEKEANKQEADEEGCQGGADGRTDPEAVQQEGVASNSIDDRDQNAATDVMQRSAGGS